MAHTGFNIESYIFTLHYRVDFFQGGFNFFPVFFVNHIDFCIVGTDRITRNGDVCNKIGTYLKALAARDNGVPFYAAVPSSSIDWRVAEPRARVNEAGMTFKERVVPGRPLKQLFVIDPEGVLVEINFRS